MELDIAMIAYYIHAQGCTQQPRSSVLRTAWTGEANESTYILKVWGISNRYPCFQTTAYIFPKPEMISNG